ncbi:MAG TPA: CAP domain-containing protein [Terriglobales bacterium]|nr:CAP domain-containing protein [Terriglobales bacterium]
MQPRFQWTFRACLYAFAIVYACSGRAEPGSSSAQRILLDSVNAERKAQGIAPLAWDEALALAARGHAAEMARQNSVAHVLPGEPSLPSRATRAGAKFTWLSENVVSASNVDTAQAQFMKSPAHRANILDPDMDRIGIGVAHRGGQVFVVQDFSKGK